MFFSLDHVLGSIKSMSLPDYPVNSSHCQRLTHCAKKLGFNSYESLRAYLNNPPQDRADAVYESIMKKVCTTRLMDEGKSYIIVRIIDDSYIAYSSTLVGWDFSGKPVQPPHITRHDNKYIMEFREVITIPACVIEAKSDLIAWFNLWHGVAFVSSELAKAELSELYRTEDVFTNASTNEPVEMNYIEFRPGFKTGNKCKYSKEPRQETVNFLYHDDGSAAVVSASAAKEKRISELEVLCQQLKEENEILKKAAAIIIADRQKSLI